MNVDSEAHQAGIYLRISHDPDATRLGVQRQRQDCEELVLKKGWVLAGIYEDNDISAYSGRLRPQYRRLLEDLKAGVIQAVVAWDPDRLHRSPRELEEFIGVIESAHAYVATVQGGELDLTTANGRMTARVVGAVARHESEHKSERLKRKHLELANAGKVTGGSRPFGYEKDQKTIRPLEANLIHEASRRLLQGESFRSICNDWNSRGIRSAKGGNWQASSLRFVLSSARISGRREMRRSMSGRRLTIGKVITQAEWPAIISIDESDRLRSLLANPDRRTRTHKRTHLLTGGIARCGLCGTHLYASNDSKPKRGSTKRSLRCLKAPGVHGCGRIYVHAEPVEELVTEAVLRALSQGGLATAMAQRDDREAVDELLAVDAKLGDLAGDWASDRLSRAEWESAREVLRSRRDTLAKRVDSQRRAYDLDGIPEPLREAWPSLPIHRRRAVINAVIEAVVVNPAKGGSRFDPGRVGIRWRA